jgi:SAM-dependent methyltransferase
VRVDAEAWDERYRGSELVWSAGPNQFVEAELAEMRPGKALDLAAGEGRNAIWLARRGWQVTAVDYSQVGLDKGREIAGDVQLDWVCADATTWSGDASYDLCVVAYLQLPPDDRRAAVRAGFSSVRPGGTFLLVAHDSTNLTAGVGGPQDPAVLLTAEDVLADLADQDFEVVEARRVGRDVAQPDGSTLTAFDALVRLVRRGSAPPPSA